MGLYSEECLRLRWEGGGGEYFLEGLFLDEFIIGILLNIRRVWNAR